MKGVKWKRAIQVASRQGLLAKEREGIHWKHDSPELASGLIRRLNQGERISLSLQRQQARLFGKRKSSRLMAYKAVVWGSWGPGCICPLCLPPPCVPKNESELFFLCNCHTRSKMPGEVRLHARSANRERPPTGPRPCFHLAVLWKLNTGWTQTAICLLPRDFV